MGAIGIGSMIFIFLTALLSAINWRLYTVVPDAEYDEIMFRLDIGYESKPEMIGVLYAIYVTAPSLILSSLYGFILAGTNL